MSKELENLALETLELNRQIELLRIKEDRMKGILSSTDLLSTSITGDRVNLEKQVALNETLIKHREKLVELKQESIDAFQRQISQLEEIIQREGSLASERREARDMIDQLNGRIETLRDQQTELNTQVIDYTKKLEKASEGVENIRSHAANLLKTFTGITDQSKSFIGVISKNGVRGLFQMRKELSKMLTVTNVLGSAFNAIVTSTISVITQLETTAAQIASVTGRGREFQSTILGASASLRGIGIGIGDVGNALQGLLNSFAGVTEMTSSARKEFTVFASKMAALGVEAGTTGELFANLTRGLGLTSSRSKAVQIRLVDLARQLGRPARELVNDFNTMSSQLLVYGSRSIKIFEKLATASKGLGVRTNELNSIFGEQFDTFSGSAKVAGQLNSLLGRDLFNSIDLLYADPAKRLQIIRKGIRSAGIDFRNLSRPMRQAIMGVLNISDAATAMKLFGTSTEAMEKARIKAEKASASQARFNKAIAPTRTLLQRFRTALENLAVAVQPTMKVLNRLVGVINKNAGAIGGWINKVANSFLSDPARLIRGLKMIGIAIGVLFIKPLLVVGSVLAGIYTLTEGLRGNFAGAITNVKNLLTGAGSFFGSAFGGGTAAAPTTRTPAIPRTTAAARSARATVVRPAAAAPVASTASANTTIVLNGDMFGKDQVKGLINKISDARTTLA